MSGKKMILIFLVIVIIFVGAIALFNKNKTVREDKITADIENQLVKNIKEYIKAPSVQVDVRIEKFEDIDNMRFILYSFNNPMAGARHAGYAIYEIKSNSRYKRTDFGWNSSKFNNKLLGTKEGTQEKNYVIVYGMNEINENQVYEYTSGEEKRIEEFNGEYFFKKYPMGESSVGFRSISPQK